MKQYIDGKYVELTPEEIEELNKPSNDETIVTEPTVEERLFSLECAMGDIAMMLVGVEDNE